MLSRNKMKILLMSLYKPPSFNQKDFLFGLNNAYNFFCEKKTLIEDFNMIPESTKLNNCEMNK